MNSTLPVAKFELFACVLRARPRETGEISVPERKDEGETRSGRSRRPLRPVSVFAEAFASLAPARSRRRDFFCPAPADPLPFSRKNFPA